MEPGAGEPALGEAFFRDIAIYGPPIVSQMFMKNKSVIVRMRGYTEG
jgi:hypothetical protein